MNSTVNTTQPAGSSKVLWAAVGVLGIAVLGMGATLIRMQSQTDAPRTAGVSALSQPASVPAAASSSNPAAAQDITLQAKPDGAVEKPTPSTQNKAVALSDKTHTATKTIAKKYGDSNQNSNSGYSATPQVVHPRTPEPAVARAPTRSICTNCGTVERVTPVEDDSADSGVGAVAGGVLGAVVGNQVGDGNGKTLATILGAVGGGYAGNTVEKRMKRVTHYDVAVRMEDGSTRTVQQSTPASVGAQVTVEGNTLHSTSR